MDIDNFKEQTLLRFKLTHQEAALYWMELSPYVGGGILSEVVHKWHTISKLYSKKQELGIAYDLAFHTADELLLYLIQQDKISTTTFVFAQQIANSSEDTVIHITVEN
jgi:hypothetical protein